ncbi:MAG: glycoside hydrolase family 16 protein [Pyrinomonadaceae bacterium]
MKKTLAVGLVFIVIAAILSCRGAVSSPSARPLHDTARSGPNSDPAGTSSPRPAVRTLQFSGYDWIVKASDRRVGPGPNYFSDSSDNVWIDAQGQLHLRLTQRDGRWSCAEVVSVRSFGYGTYRFYLNTPVDNLDPQVILGMFTWDDDPAYSHREIDIEVSRWGQANNQNGQFVVQPYIHPQNIVRFQLPPDLQSSAHFFTWKPDNVFCQSLKGLSTTPPTPSLVIQQHLFTQDIPRAGGENARINLWLMAGRPPTDGKETEIIISKFEFVELSN